ncbi:unnamed protein product [Cochlearia groenlandica]
MAYIPPHKRHSKDFVKPSPLPDSIISTFNKNISVKSSKAVGNAIVYSRDSISRWFLIGSNGIEDDDVVSLELVPLSSDSTECRNGEKPLVLTHNNVHDKVTKESEEEERIQWMLVANKLENDLNFAYEKAKKVMKDYYQVDNAKLRLVARFGTTLFYGLKAGSVTGLSLRNSKRIFSTDVSNTFIHNIKSKVVPSHEFCRDEDKETYIVKVSHYTCPNTTISCKCTMKDDGRLSMYKAELNHVRHLVVDMSCINKSMDVRLMLAANRKIMALTEKEKSNIQELLDSTNVDSNAKGGVTWSLGSSRDGYRIFEVCRVTSTIYKNKTLKLRIRETDRFNKISGEGEIKCGVTLILKDINTKLHEKDFEMGCVMQMLQDAFGYISDFLGCDAE